MAELSLKNTDRFMPLLLGPTAHGALQEFIDIDVTADDLVRLLRADKPYKQLFARFVKKKIRYRAPGEEEEKKGEKGEKKAAPPTPTHRLVSLLGMIGSRNLIISLRMHEAVYGTFPEDQEGNLDIKASDYLKTAMQFEEFFQRNRLEYPETAFAAGVLFDWLILSLRQTGNHKKLEPFVQSTVKTALRAGALAYELARRLPGQLPKQSMPAAMIASAGLLLLADAAPETFPAEFKAIDDNKRLDAEARLILERARWGLSYEEASAQALHYFSVFRPFAPVVRRSREPYVLKDADPAHYAQANLLLLTGELNRLGKIPSEAELSAVAPLAQAALRLKPAVILEALRKAATYR